MKTKAIVILTAALFVMSAVFVLAPQTEEYSGASGFKITDGQGTEFTYDGPSEKVMTIGKGLSATVIELGYVSKIVVCDSYSKTATEDVFTELKALVGSGTILADGTIYSSGKDALFNNIVYATDNGKFNKDTDTILISGSPTYLVSIVGDLKDLGFKKVVVWNDITTYDEMVDYVETVSMVLSGDIGGKAKQMAYVAEYIEDTLGDREKANAFYVTYSGGTFKVGNTGSLATSMIQAAGGNAVTIDDSKAKPTYEDNVTEIIRIYGMDTIVFVDSLIVNNETNLNNLKSQLPEVTLVPLDTLWNNFAPDSMDGVWVMASAMYPDLFEGDVPVIPSGDDPDMLLYIGIAAIAVVAICVVGFLFMRKG